VNITPVIIIEPGTATLMAVLTIIRPLNMIQAT